MSAPEIKRALLSVYDKTGIVDFARALADEFKIEIISTGGTARLLKENDIPVTMVEEVTGLPEMMDGRVKTLHPKIHAAILANRDNAEHMRQLAEQGIEPIDMVVVNLYPFEKTVADPNCTFEQAIEMIDIGGPCMLRAAAKNHRHVIVGCSKLDYELILDTLRSSKSADVCVERMREWASRVFWTTHLYEAQVHAWLESQKNGAPWCPEMALVRLNRLDVLRYGENPHVPGARYERRKPDGSGMFEADLATAQSSTSATSLSYNNYADGHAALELCKELTRELVTKSVGPTFQSVIPAVTHEQHTERHLPHIQEPGANYFVTFRIRSGTLIPEEREIVFSACKRLHGEEMTVHACVVMPDHVHLLITPHESAPGSWIPLGEIARSIKGFSARRINQLRKESGSVWQDEIWDRVVRNEEEFGQRWEYIENNPVKADLGEEYPWLWLNDRSWHDLAEHDRLESRSHSESREDASFAVVFIKHTNACGASVRNDPIEAYRQAYLGDPNAAMGGVLACGFDITADFAQTVMETYSRFGKQAGAGGFFVEVWIAPSFSEKAVAIIRSAKKWGERVRLLSVGEMSKPPDQTELEYKSIAGGMLVQTRDLIGLNEDQWKVVTKRTPTEAEMADLRLAWLVCKHTKSNAISICKDGMLIGNGAGQMSRVMSCRIATWLAKENGHEENLSGSVAASDAFFPFPDGANVLLDAGVTAIIQPGGSKRDADTIAACDDRGAAMVHTGVRHFRH